MLTYFFFTFLPIYFLTNFFLLTYFPIFFNYLLNYFLTYLLSFLFKPTGGPGEVTFADTKVTVNEEGQKRRLPMGRKPRVIPLKPYAGMNKEDLLRFSNTPFWNRLRMAFLVVGGTAFNII